VPFKTETTRGLYIHTSPSLHVLGNDQMLDLVGRPLAFRFGGHVLRPSLRVDLLRAILCTAACCLVKIREHEPASTDDKTPHPTYFSPSFHQQLRSTPPTTKASCFVFEYQFVSHSSFCSHLSTYGASYRGRQSLWLTLQARPVERRLV
jgi:hypothetical protein